MSCRVGDDRVSCEEPVHEEFVGEFEWKARESLARIVLASINPDAPQIMGQTRSS